MVKSNLSSITSLSLLLALTTMRPMPFTHAFVPVRTRGTATATTTTSASISHARLFASSHSPTNTATTRSSPKNVAVVGGGLAGLSTSYHLLKKDQNVRVTIFDKTKPGQGGASSVAGGLLHPFSPRGKLVHLGMEGLEITNELIDVAQVHRPDCVLRNQIYRIALTEKNKEQLAKTAELYPHYATWLPSNEILATCQSGSEKVLGGIRLTNGCKVVHVPTYLDGLWSACQEMSRDTATWVMEDTASDDIDWKDRLQEFDAVVLAAGSGLFHDGILGMDDSYAGADATMNNFPVELVRGQSIEMTMPSTSASEEYVNEALLCGKYFAPLTGKNQVLIGATHEYKANPLNAEEVQSDLKKRSYDIAPLVWDQGTVGKITSGYRVQSRRGKHGRMPIIGRWLWRSPFNNDIIHDNAWIFTGLSARGLIYHGVYGKLLTSAIARGDESVILDDQPDVYWWK